MIGHGNAMTILAASSALRRVFRPVRRLQRLVSFNRRTRVEQQSLGAQPLVEAGVPHDFENARVQPRQPYVDPTCGHPLLTSGNFVRA